MPDRPVLLIDGLNIFMRHFVVNPALSESGFHVGGAVGFLNSIKHLSNRIGPSRIIVAWEGGGSSRRRTIFKDYKQGRRPQRLNRYYKDDLPDTVENRDDQISLIIDLLKNTHVEQIYVSDCEADDIISYLSQDVFKDKRIVIASSDKDLYQLLSKRIIQWSPGQKKFITVKDVKNKFGISSTNFCTARCFVGDASDGLPGVPRAGFATLSKRFPELQKNEFMSVEDIVELSKKRLENSKILVYNSIVENKDIAKRNWKLMYLSTNTLSESQVRKIDFLLDENNNNPNKLELIRKIMKFGIKNFDVDGFYSSILVTRRSTH
tara:strand:- start:288 stop:1250 length:963 start_codon:yes stop_codon:yes gene_type:complete